MNITRHVFFLLSALLVSGTCLAAWPVFEVSMDNLVYVLFTFYAIAVLSPLLALASYFSGSRLLNAVAWLFAILCLLTPPPVMATSFSLFAAIIPAGTLVILLTKTAKRASGDRFLVVYLLRAIGIIVMVFVPVALLLHTSLYGSRFSLAAQLFLLIVFNVLLGILGYRLYHHSRKKKFTKAGPARPLLWCVLPGAGAWFIYIKYIVVWCRMHLRIAPDMHQAIYLMPFPNIFISLLTWVLTGMTIYFLHNKFQKKLRGRY